MLRLSHVLNALPLHWTSQSCRLLCRLISSFSIPVDQSFSVLFINDLVGPFSQLKNIILLSLLVMASEVKLLLRRLPRICVKN